MKTLYSNCQIFDGISKKVKKNAWFIVDEETGKIAQVGEGQ